MPQKKISLRIDGELVNAVEGQTILDATRASGKSIPTLCFLEGLSPVGACRLCMVEVSGIDRLFPACTTPAQDGMAVATTSALTPWPATERKSLTLGTSIPRSRAAARNGSIASRPMSGLTVARSAPSPRRTVWL